MAAAAALLAFAVAGEVAASRARGPGSFAVEIIDALYGLDRETLRIRGEGGREWLSIVRLYALSIQSARAGTTCRRCRRSLAEGGATLVQLRDKHSDTRAMIETARAIKAASHRSGCRC